jgi:hypothetical protein
MFIAVGIWQVLSKLTVSLRSERAMLKRLNFLKFYCMAKQRASSLSELGSLNAPGEVAISTRSSETTKAQA